MKDRLRSRVDGLRKQAHVFLVLAIAVLILGVVIFGGANYIARLTLSSPETAAAQYDKAIAAQKRLGEQQEELNRQKEEIINGADVVGPRNEVKEINAELTVLEADILQHCGKYTFLDASKFLPELGPFRVTEQDPYTGRHMFLLRSGRAVSFENRGASVPVHWKLPTVGLSILGPAKYYIPVYWKLRAVELS